MRPDGNTTWFVFVQTERVGGFPNWLSKETKQLKKYRLWCHKCTNFLLKISQLMPNKPQIFSNVIVFKQSIFLDIRHKGWNYWAFARGLKWFYFFIFSKAVEFWGLVGLLSSSPIPSFHVGFKSIYCYGWRKPKKTTTKKHLYAHGGCGSSDVNWISYVN